MKEITLEKVLEIINNNLEYANIKLEQADEELSQFGMDSVIFICIIISLEKEYDCEIPDSKLLLNQMNTINKIVSVLKEI